MIDSRFSIFEWVVQLSLTYATLCFSNANFLFCFTLLQYKFFFSFWWYHLTHSLDKHREFSFHTTWYQENKGSKQSLFNIMFWWSRSLLPAKVDLFEKQKIDFKQLKPKKYLKHIWQLIIRTSNVALEVSLQRPWDPC